MKTAAILSVLACVCTWVEASDASLARWNLSFYFLSGSGKAMSELDDMRGLPYTPAPAPQVWLGTEPPTALLLRPNRLTGFVEASAPSPLHVSAEPTADGNPGETLLSLSADAGRTVVFVRRNGGGRLTAFPMKLGAVRVGDMVFANLSQREITAKIGTELHRIPSGQRTVISRPAHDAEAPVEITTAEKKVLYHGFLRAPRGGSLFFVTLENPSRSLETVRLSLFSNELKILQ